MTWEFIKTDTMPDGGVNNLPRTVVPFVWYFARQVKWQLGAIALCFGLSSLMFSFLPYGVKVVVDSLGPNATDTSFQAIGFFVGIFAIRMVFECAGDLLGAHSWAPYCNFMRRQLSMYVGQHAYRFFQDDFAGRIASKVMETPKAILMLTLSMTDQVMYVVFLIVGTALMFLGVDWKYLAIISVWVVSYVFILWWSIPKILDQTKIASKELNITRGRYVDIISNILTLKVFARGYYEDQVLHGHLRQSSRLYLIRDRSDTLMSWWIYLSLFLMFAASLSLIGYQSARGMITPGNASMILGGLIFLSNSSVWVSKMFSDLFKTYGEIYEGIDLITAAHEVVDQPNAPTLTVTRGEIKLDHVHFAYPGRLVFPDLSLHIPPGQKVGLVGPSGAGKSTLVQLLLRLYDIQSGSIRMDDQNIATHQQDSLRAQIAVIPQNSDLLHRSIRDNILYGRLDATEDEVIKAAHLAHAHDFILQLVDKDGRTGYDAQVGERGVKLSGGQRQRIAIARAILKNAPILLLDEATSALDSESEALIQASLFELMKGRTVMAIAHRLSTIQHMDRLLVMRDGQIIEDGSHAELLARNGYYASLWARQAGGFLNL